MSENTNPLKMAAQGKKMPYGGPENVNGKPGYMSFFAVPGTNGLGSDGTVDYRSGNYDYPALHPGRKLLLIDKDHPAYDKENGGALQIHAVKTKAVGTKAYYNPEGLGDPEQDLVIGKIDEVVGKEHMKGVIADDEGNVYPVNAIPLSEKDREKERERNPSGQVRFAYFVLDLPKDWGGETMPQGATPRDPLKTKTEAAPNKDLKDREAVEEGPEGAAGDDGKPTDAEDEIPFG
jgi:hypothetical protein